MAFWAAAIPALKAAAPYIMKFGGAALSALGGNNLLGGGSDDSPNGSGITYTPSVVTGQVQTDNNNGLFSNIAGQQRMGKAGGLYGRLIQ